MASRKIRCGQCAYCVQPNCGRCKHCVDMKKFGGLQIKKQCCVNRRCPFRKLKPPSFTLTRKVQRLRKSKRYLKSKRYQPVVVLNTDKRQSEVQPAAGSHALPFPRPRIQGFQPVVRLQRLNEKVINNWNGSKLKNSETEQTGTKATGTHEKQIHPRKSENLVGNTEISAPDVENVKPTSGKKKFPNSRPRRVGKLIRPLKSAKGKPLSDLSRKKLCLKVKRLGHLSKCQDRDRNVQNSVKAARKLLKTAIQRARKSRTHGEDAALEPGHKTESAKQLRKKKEGSQKKSAADQQKRLKEDSSEKSGEFFCDLCDKSFELKAFLWSHLWIYHKDSAQTSKRKHDSSREDVTIVKNPHLDKKPNSPSGETSHSGISVISLLEVWLKEQKEKEN